MTDNQDYDGPEPRTQEDDIERKVKLRVKKRVSKIVGAVVFGVVIALLIGLVFGFLVKWLWNGVPAELFDLPTITYWQAVGLLILAKLFFGFGIGGGSTGNGRKRRHEPEGGEVSLRFELSGRDRRFRDYWENEGKSHWEDWKRRDE